MQIGLQGYLERLAVDMPRRAAIFLTVLTATIFAAGLRSTAARADGGPLLCAGYAGCSTAGFTTHGYPLHEWAMWWRMYAGDNCTNYAAYVESQVFGVSDPGYLLGNAYQWAGNAAAHGVPVDSTPSVGAVAVWGPGSTGMTGYGHVAIVEAVGPDNSYIDVSQSGMGDTADGYNWERIYPGGSAWESWPQSFIHFPGTNIPKPVQPKPTPPPPPPPPPPPAWPGEQQGQLTWASASPQVPGPVGSADASVQLPGLW